MNDIIIYIGESNSFKGISLLMDNMYNNANTDELNIKIAENLKSTASIDFTKLGSDILLNPAIYSEMPLIKYIASLFDSKKNVHDQFYLIKVARFLNAVRYGLIEKKELNDYIINRECTKVWCFWIA